MTVSRPRPRARFVLDPDNAYTRLGVSPLASTQEIEVAIARRRREVRARVTHRDEVGFGAEEAELAALQELERKIGTSAARQDYDRARPQNVLMTVQPAALDVVVGPARSCELATAWLADELGPGARLAHPGAAWLWRLDTLAPALASRLAAFDLSPSVATSTATPTPSSLPAALVVPIEPGELAIGSAELASPCPEPHRTE